MAAPSPTEQGEKAAPTPFRTNTGPLALLQHPRGEAPPSPDLSVRAPACCAPAPLSRGRDADRTRGAMGGAFGADSSSGDGMSKNKTLNKKQHNCPEVVCEQRKDGTRTLGGGVEQEGQGRAGLAPCY